MKRPVAAVAAAALAGCTSLTPQAKLVRVTEDANVVQGCKYLGAVRASDRMNGGLLGQDIADSNVEKRLQNKAAEKGGDTVLMKMHSSGTSGASGRGEVYLCAGRMANPTGSPAPAPKE